MVILPAGIEAGTDESPTTNFCGYHGYLCTLNGEVDSPRIVPRSAQIGVYSVSTDGNVNDQVPLRSTATANGDGWLDWTIADASHELFESITDPFRGMGWITLDNAQEEIADVCEQYEDWPGEAGGYDVVLNGHDYLVNPLLSNVQDALLSSNTNQVACSLGFDGQYIDFGLALGNGSVQNGGSVQYGLAPFTVAASATSGLPVTFQAGGGACSVGDVQTATPQTTAQGTNITGTSAQVTLTGTGTCTITASQPGNQGSGGFYDAAAPVTQSFTVTPGTGTRAVRAHIRRPATLPAPQPTQAASCPEPGRPPRHPASRGHISRRRVSRRACRRMLGTLLRMRVRPPRHPASRGPTSRRRVSRRACRRMPGTLLRMRVRPPRHPASRGPISRRPVSRRACLLMPGTLLRVRGLRLSRSASRGPTSRRRVSRRACRRMLGTLLRMRGLRLRRSASRGRTSRRRVSRRACRLMPGTLLRMRGRPPRHPASRGPTSRRRVSRRACRRMPGTLLRMRVRPPRHPASRGPTSRRRVSRRACRLMPGTLLRMRGRPPRHPASRGPISRRRVSRRACRLVSATLLRMRGLRLRRSASRAATSRRLGSVGLSADAGNFVANAGSASESQCLPGTYQPNTVSRRAWWLRTAITFRVPGRRVRPRARLGRRTPGRETHPARRRPR